MEKQSQSDLPHSKSDHLSNLQYWRDIILGVNDGLVSIFLLVAGVVGGGMDNRGTLLTAAAGAIAGAISMGAGEYLATKSQNDVFSGEISLEKLHIDRYHSDEVEEVQVLLNKIGISENTSLTNQLVKYYRENDEALLQLMMALEFGFIKEQERSSIKAALFSGISFTFGALPSIIPFCFRISNGLAIVIAALFTAFGLAIVGSCRALATRGSSVRAALENVTIAGLSGIVAYFIGEGIGSIINE